MITSYSWNKMLSPHRELNEQLQALKKQDVEKQKESSIITLAKPQRMSLPDSYNPKERNIAYHQKQQFISMPKRQTNIQIKEHSNQLKNKQVLEDLDSFEDDEDLIIPEYVIKKLYEKKLEVDEENFRNKPVNENKQRVSKKYTRFIHQLIIVIIIIFAIYQSVKYFNQVPEQNDWNDIRQRLLNAGRTSQLNKPLLASSHKISEFAQEIESEPWEYVKFIIQLSITLFVLFQMMHIIKTKLQFY